MNIQVFKDFQPTILAFIAAGTYIFKKFIDNIFYAQNYKIQIITNKKIESYSILCEALSKLKSSALTYCAEIKQPLTKDQLANAKYKLAKSKNDFDEVLHANFAFIVSNVYLELLDFSEYVVKDIALDDFSPDYVVISTKFMTTNASIVKAIREDKFEGKHM